MNRATLSVLLDTDRELSKQEAEEFRDMLYDAIDVWDKTRNPDRDLKVDDFYVSTVDSRKAAR